MWQFESLDVYPTYGALTNVVQSIHWRITADDGDGHTAQAYGEEVAGPPDPDNFIPFSELTSSVVQGWAEEAMGSELSTLMAYLDSAVQLQANPVTVSVSPPWV